MTRVTCKVIVTNIIIEKNNCVLTIIYSNCVCFSIRWKYQGISFPSEWYRTERKGGRVKSVVIIDKSRGKQVSSVNTHRRLRSVSIDYLKSTARKGIVSFIKVPTTMFPHLCRGEAGYEWEFNWGLFFAPVWSVVSYNASLVKKFYPRCTREIFSSEIPLEK